MDTYSAAETARAMGTSLPRVKRAIAELELDVEERPGGRVRLTAEHLERLAGHIGAFPSLPGFTRVELQVLTALGRSPLGLISVRAVARRAGLSPTAASRALSALGKRGLVRRERRFVAAGRAREFDVFRLAFASRYWQEIAPTVAHVRLPEARYTRSDRQVPRRLRHLFWNTAPEQLDTEQAGGYIARRLLTTGDLEGIAWGAENLSRGDWQKAAASRGLDPSRRALARNLARRGNSP
jgi:DNA-binding transcriptional regulator YhcF (GntR family)